MTISGDSNNIFQLAADFVNQTSEHVFLTGKAGTGKTTFLKYICEHTHKRTLVAAPTGVAAINAGGTTLHSLFQLPLEPYIPGFSNASLKKNFYRFSKQKIDLLKHLELLIIDEVSMLRADTLDAIDATLRTVRRIQRPLGGVQILYIGDMFQLPPVAKDDEWQLLKEHYSSTFFFHAKVFQQTKPIYLELKKVYRQRDDIFVDLLNRVRNNVATNEDLQELNKRYNPSFVPDEEDKYIILTTHNYKAENINNRKLMELPDPERVFHGETDGDFPDYSLPTERKLMLKKGAQVMFLKNDTEDPRRYYNGKIATISRIDADQIYVYIPEIKGDIMVKKETWENKRYYLDKESGNIKEELLGSFSQYPLRLAWAITVHKSQGLTFEKAIIDIDSSFAAGQAYVALSRCTSLDGIVLYSKINFNCIRTDNYALEFSRNEKTEQELNMIFHQGKRKFWADRLFSYFSWKQIYSLLRDMEKLLEEKNGNEYITIKKLLPEFRNKVCELENVTIKFQEQLRRIVQQESTENDISLLKERTQKAVAYFHQQFIAQVLCPLQNYIKFFTPSSKNKTFYKNMIEIEKDMILFLENMKKIRYNNIPLCEELTLEIPRMEKLFEKKK
ncbi:MAG: AAA family ATPase [Dysgonamonadaceae bacterium]|jgi:ATP-dependent exoDNAse (exonuclease V) alpha subunit|nr:AAA family ATPase [Dysgonamonadaceae bacterium]